MMSGPVEIWRNHKKLSYYLNKVGRIIVWTKVLVPPAGFEHEAPYLVGIIDFEDLKMPLQIVDCKEEDLKPNQKVITVIRKIGKAKSEDVIEYGIKVKPVKHLGGGL